ncbi:MAG: 4'-phosphopantetheinyl transferase superfamily protein [Hahellaceae bacterium]|nr:4'-phosphopantetheinyl transferase superfamily protein [Hahellaceae bacterium]
MNHSPDLAIYYARAPSGEADYQALLSSARTYLDEDELAYIARFHFLKDRALALTSRCLKRVVLARRLSTEPRLLTFTQSAKGKPQLSGVRGPAFNLSHSSPWVVLVTGDDPELKLGIDIEDSSRPALPVSALPGFFSPSEIRKIVLCEGTGAVCANEFFKYWTLKEALLKATGEGLSGDIVGEFNLDTSRIQFTPFLDSGPRWQFWSQHWSDHFRISVAAQRHQAIDVLHIKEIRL